MNERSSALVRAGPVVVLGLLLLGTACGGTTTGSAPLGTVPTTTTPAPSTTSTSAAPETTTSTTAAPVRSTTAPATTAPAGEELSGFQTEPFRREHNLTVPPLPTLTGIRSAAHPGYDRIVFDFDGPLPGAVSVRYVDRVIADGSGIAVDVAGNAYLQVRFEEAQAHTEDGATTVTRRSQPGLPVLTEIVVAGDYEGYVTVALGLDARSPFRVQELSNPTRVVVDVASGR